jgi:putative Mg2+ transporter-C (MgtC) family protein
MSTLFAQINFEQYWSAQVVEANIVVFLNLLGALGLGLILGYERSFHGRAAGMRTYSLVCLASAGLTVIIGYSGLWFGGNNHEVVNAAPIIQGIITGVGFLGAGVIIKEGFTISGLTTAASIWSASAVGILIGVGFYMSAMLLSVLSAMVMMWVSKIESLLPSRHAIAINLVFHQDFTPNEDEIDLIILNLGFEVAKGSISVTSENNKETWYFSAIALLKHTKYSIPQISRQIVKISGLESYKISFARN